MNKQRAGQLVEAAVWLQATGDQDGAVRLFEQALKFDPDNSRAKDALARHAARQVNVSKPVAAGPPPATTVSIEEVTIEVLEADAVAPPPKPAVAKVEPPPVATVVVVPAAPPPVAVAAVVASVAPPAAPMPPPARPAPSFAPAPPPFVSAALDMDWGSSLMGETAPAPPAPAVEPVPPPAAPLPVVAAPAAEPVPPPAMAVTPVPAAVAIPLVEPVPSVETPAPTVIVALDPDDQVVPPPVARTSASAVEPGLAPAQPEPAPWPVASLSGAPPSMAAPPADHDPFAVAPEFDHHAPSAPMNAWDNDGRPGMDLTPLSPIAPTESRDVMDLLGEAHPRPTPPPMRRPSEIKQEVDALVRGARDLLELDDHSGAMDLIQKAAELAPEDAVVKRLKEKSEVVLQSMYESKLGRLDARPRVVLRPDEIIWLNLDHRAGFVLAQIDGSVSYDDLFAICGMSRLDTLRILAQLSQAGVIAAAH